MKLFYYSGQLYMRVVPSKRMFQSTMIHEVVTRGDVFAVHMETGQFTVVPGAAKITVCSTKVELPALTLQQDDLFGV